MVQVCRDLVENVEDGIAAIQARDIPALGAVLDTYWGHKKCVAQGCEPAKVTRCIAHLRRKALIHGAELTGGGGGGFMLLVTQSPDQKAAIESALAEPWDDGEPIGAGMVAHTVQIDPHGVQTTLES